jgi:hypothetical protein
MPPVLQHWQRILCYENRTDAYGALPEHLNHQPLKIELSKIQNRTREIFDRLFS